MAFVVRSGNCTLMFRDLRARARNPAIDLETEPPRESRMTKKAMPLAHDQIDVLLLQALVRKLVAKSVIEPDDVRASLFDAVSVGEKASIERVSGT
jgi:hypothetical protein